LTYLTRTVMGLATLSSCFLVLALSFALYFRFLGFVRSL
jgi:hypothetical protein